MSQNLRRIFGSLDGDNFRRSVALGLIPGWATYRKFGQNDAVGTGGTEDMWPPGTRRVLPSAAGVVSVVSSSAEDGAGTATGALTVTISGLDAYYKEITETVTMNGQTPVVTTAEFFRINSAWNVTAGSNQLNVGNISLSIGGVLQAYIEANEGQTHQTLLTIPAGKTLILDGYRLGIGRMGGSSDAHFKGQVLLPGHTAWRTISDIYLYNGETYDSGANTATVLPAKTEARISITSSSATQAYGVMSGLIVENKYLSNMIQNH